MDIMARAFALIARKEAAMAAGARARVFDWNGAAKRIAATKPFVAEAGLIEDWPSTGGEIFRDGKPVPEDNTYVYLSSIWATPTLIMDGVSEPCWVYEEDSPGWDSGTYWPKSALDLLRPQKKQKPGKSKKAE